MVDRADLVSFTQPQRRVLADPDARMSPRDPKPRCRVKVACKGQAPSLKKILLKIHNPLCSTWTSIAFFFWKHHLDKGSMEQLTQGDTLFL